MKTKLTEFNQEILTLLIAKKEMFMLSRTEIRLLDELSSIKKEEIKESEERIKANSKRVETAHNKFKRACG